MDMTTNTITLAERLCLAIYAVEQRREREYDDDDRATWSVTAAVDVGDMTTNTLYTDREMRAAINGASGAGLLIEDLSPWCHTVRLTDAGRATATRHHDHLAAGGILELTA
jgi:hypothetical protein